MVEIMEEVVLFLVTEAMEVVMAVEVMAEEVVLEVWDGGGLGRTRSWYLEL